MLVARVVDDLLITGVRSDVDEFLVNLNEKFPFVSAVRGPEIIKFHGMNIVLNDNCSASIHADEKLNALDGYPLSRVRRRQFDSTFTEVEKSSSCLSTLLSVGLVLLTHFYMLSTHPIYSRLDPLLLSTRCCHKQSTFVY